MNLINICICIPNDFKYNRIVSTTAVTPSLWIAIYDKYRSSVVFFVTFIIICVFYMHSLGKNSSYPLCYYCLINRLYRFSSFSLWTVAHFIVLSVVFQIYIHAMKLIRERSITDRQEALNLAFLALRKKNSFEGEDANLADVQDIRKALQLLRPHYNDTKVRAIVKLFNIPSTKPNSFLLLTHIIIRLIS